MTQNENTSTSTGTGSGSGTENAAAPRPYFEVVRGNPTPEQVGILTAVFATAEGNAAVAARNPDSGARNDWGRSAEKTRGVFWNSTSSYLNEKFL